MLTYQDYLEEKDGGKLGEFLAKVIREHKASAMYKLALEADEYDKERNTTIMKLERFIYSGSGMPIKDETAANNKITTNFFARLNKQRCTYSLGNGLEFPKDGTADKLGWDADKKVFDGGYYALIHGVSFLYWAYDEIRLFKLTEFAPLWDEETGNLGAGVRFWQLEADKPVYATLYDADGYLEFVGEKGRLAELKPKTEDFQPYRMTVHTTPATMQETVDAYNYSGLPVVPLWGSKLHQSTLVGMRSKIDTYDMIISGFANDLQECAQIYWIINNAGGMTEKDISDFRQRLLYRHMANVNTADGVDIKPYTQEVPHTARAELLKSLKEQIYEDFGGLDVHTVAAGATNDHIDAAYQPLDEEADDFEYQVIAAVRGLLALQGVDAKDATPQFKRNRVSNQREQTEVIMLAASYLDDETIVKKLPFLTPEEAEEALKRKAAEEIDRNLVEQDRQSEESEDVIANA